MSPKNFWSWKLKNQRVSHYNFRDSGSILIKHFPYDVPRGKGHNICITLGSPHPLNLGVRKNIQNSARFLTTFDFDRRYLRKAPYIQNLKEIWSTAIPPAFHEESLVNFGPQTKKFYWLTLSHSSGFFRGDYISALRGCCPLKFLYALAIDQALIAHTQMGMGVPPVLG